MKKFEAEDAVSNAKIILSERYPDAQFGIAAGSIVLGKGTVASDLDLVIIFSQITAAFRESFIFNGMPVEAFIHDYETIQAFMDEDYNAHAAIIHMVASGQIIPSQDETAIKLKEYASALMKKGPEQTDQTKIKALRYFISDKIDDLRGERSAEEQRAILYALYPQIGELALRQAEKFVANGKHLAKRLQESCPALFESFEDIMKAAHTKRLGTEHIQKLDELLTSLGGHLFDGYKLDAPPDKRAKARWLEWTLPTL